MDRDLQSIQEARELVKKAKRAQEIIECYSQQEVDRLVSLMAEHGYRASREIAQLAHEETGLGKTVSKTAKNEFATREVYDYLKNEKTVGIVRTDPDKKVYEIASPMGIVVAIIPCTNPTATAFCKMLIATKARCPIILSPHPRAVRCIGAAADIMRKAATSIGAPEDLIGCLSLSTLDATQTLMKHPDIGVILATGGSGLVKAAYSSGKPALGVGPGNVPALIERSADVEHAVRCLVESQEFDWGTLCCSEQAVVIDRPVEQQCLSLFQRHRAHICNEHEIRALEALQPAGAAINPDLVGLSPHTIANKAGFQVPQDTTVILARQYGVGNKHPLSREKLAPILALYTEDGWRACSQRCQELLAYGGMGHSFAIHSKNQDIITECALMQHASRILVNAPTGPGGCGLGTGLVPSLTLGCGSLGGNITSDNITAHHLLNIKRVAFGDATWFPDLPAPQVDIGQSQEQVYGYRSDPFDSVATRNHKHYYVGPHNNPNI